MTLINLALSITNVDISQPSRFDDMITVTTNTTLYCCVLFLFRFTKRVSVLNQAALASIRALF